MKNLIFSVLFVLLFSGVVFAQTQTDLNIEAGQRYELADRELNLVYNQIRARYAHSPLLLEKLRDAQRLWIQFRDASVLAVFPEDNPRDHYGSMYPMLVSNLLERLTRDRIQQLREVYLEQFYY